MPDGSQWSAAAATAAASKCGRCGCRTPLWPVSQCEVTLIPTRPGLADHDHLGWGSRVTTMLTTAPFALLNGYGFQWPVHVCAQGDRQHIHCFFQPLSHCGGRAEQLCPDDETFGACSAWLNRNPTRSDHVTQRYHEPTDEEITRACASAASLLRTSASSCASQADGRLLAWRVIARLLMRPQPEIQERAERIIPAQFLSWMGGQYGAVHIRRGDKVFGNNAETSALPPCMYLERLAVMSSSARGLDVFVATDDLTILPELQGCAVSKPLAWRLHHINGGPGRGIGDDVTYRLWAEMSILRRSTWCVATYSSNVGRLVQMLRDQAPGSMISLDRAWFMRP